MTSNDKAGEDLIVRFRRWLFEMELELVFKPSSNAWSNILGLLGLPSSRTRSPANASYVRVTWLWAKAVWSQKFLRNYPWMGTEFDLCEVEPLSVLTFISKAGCNPVSFPDPKSHQGIEMAWVMVSQLFCPANHVDNSNWFRIVATNQPPMLLPLENNWWYLDLPSRWLEQRQDVFVQCGSQGVSVLFPYPCLP